MCVCAGSVRTLVNVCCNSSVKSFGPGFPLLNIYIFNFCFDSTNILDCYWLVMPSIFYSLFSDCVLTCI